MSVTIRGQTYCRTTEVCRMIGISRSTLVRWLEKGVLEDASYRDVRGWRLFTEADIKRIEEAVNKVDDAQNRLFWASLYPELPGQVTPSQ